MMSGRRRAAAAAGALAVLSADVQSFAFTSLQLAVGGKSGRFRATQERELARRSWNTRCRSIRDGCLPVTSRIAWHPRRRTSAIRYYEDQVAKPPARVTCACPRVRRIRPELQRQLLQPI